MWPFKKKAVPIALPMGKEAFIEFADAIYEGAQVPGLTRESAHFSIAAMILHKPSTESFATLEFFVHALRKAAANQVAHDVIQEIQTKKTSAVTPAPKEGVANGQEVLSN